MAFQFLCPQGHLLQGDETHVGLQTRCPYCNEQFLIPPVQTELTPPVVEEVAGESHGGFPQNVRDFLSDVTGQESAATEEETIAIRSEQLTLRRQPDSFAVTRKMTFLHIPCPQGHELESPHDMLGQEVRCPLCGVQFRLQQANSREYLEEQEQQEADRSRRWLKGAIAAAAIIGGGLLVLLTIALKR
jgi:DNA-directed RNA polymerase subunit RPC12/RpoP